MGIKRPALVAVWDAPFSKTVAMRKTYLIIGALTLVSIAILTYCAYDQYSEARTKRIVRKQIEQDPIFAQVNHIADSLANVSGNSTRVVVNFDGSNYATIGIKEKKLHTRQKSTHGREYRYRYQFTNYAIVMFDQSSGKILQVSKMRQM